MKKIYEAPELFVDEYAADTMIASSGALAKNGNDHNLNCFGCDYHPEVVVGEDYCMFYPGDGGWYEGNCM